MDVSTRFNAFLNNLRLTTDQREDGQVKHGGVRECLNKWYYGWSSPSANSFLVGSWGKETRIRPPRDIDIMFVLPVEVYHRINLVIGNKQSYLLQEVKGALQRTYSTTTMRGDGQVVMVPFSSYSVEVVPAFVLDNGQYWICETGNGGSYKKTDPKAEMSNIEASNTATNGNTRDLIRMLKRWQYWCSVPLKSFWIELLVIEFLQTWTHRGQSTIYYDYMVRDFFRWLSQKGRSPYNFFYVPGTYESISIGNEWASRADTALGRAEKACEYEAKGLGYLAGDEWQKIFGDFIPTG